MFSGNNNLSQYNPRNFIIWMTLAFQAGSINAGGFLACHKFVTHTTGFATAFGAELAAGELLAAVSMASVPLFFLAGTMISAYLVDHQINQHLRPRYNLILMLIAGFMLLVTALGQSGAFGYFGNEYNSLADYMLLALLSLTSGLQNAAISSASGSSIRTTHLTGITTDLGIGIVRVLSVRTDEHKRTSESRANFTRAGIIAFFILGSAFSAFVFMKSHFLGFLVPAGTALAILISGLISRGHKTHPQEHSSSLGSMIGTLKG